jgi:hypothetical protein
MIPSLRGVAPVADRRRPWLALALALSLTLAGCGISTTGATDEGDGLTTGTSQTDTEGRQAPSPDTATSAEELVKDYLAAASGGPTQVKAFLTDNALKTWKDPANKDNPPLTIIHLMGSPQFGVVNGNSTITLTYRVVGTLTDQGRVDDLANPAQQRVTFQVVPDAQGPSLRIAEISFERSPPPPDSLMLVDSALDEYYRIQPIYFWDTNNTALVPDLRYLPLTITAELRAQRVVQYLAGGSSPWLSGVLRVPAGAIPTEPVTSQNGTLVLKFPAELGAVGEDDLKRLLYQLQWSLSTPNRTPTIALQIDDKIANINVAANDFVPYNLSSTFASPAQRYDLTAEGKVVGVPAAPTPQGLLASPDNQNVTSAAISRRGDVAAYVRNVSGSRFLAIVHANGARVEALRGLNVGRPAFTSSNGDVVVPASGRLYTVSATDGKVTEVLNSLSGVSAVSVSPDARRVAVVASGQVYVTSFPFATGQQPVRPILSGQFAAASVAWTNETWLMVSGVGALWRVTADGVVADDQSGKLLGLTVSDVLAYPQWPARGQPDVIAQVPGVGSYSVYTLSDQPVKQDPYNAAFFGS